MPNIESFKIYPSIGIARLGNAPTDFFIGPEIPGKNAKPAGGYKDEQGRIKRQAARFRIYGYDENGLLVKEVTSADAQIKWTVHLANKKASWKEFQGLSDNTPLRNKKEKQRSKLIIDPGSRTLSKINSEALFDTGKFYNTSVPLGEMRTDHDGRLFVLGGFGRSGSPKKTKMTTYANNDGWYDDVSDGPVTASIMMKGTGIEVEASASWLICAPPDFAPGIANVLSLYDTLLQGNIDMFDYKMQEVPSFTHHIYPIIASAVKVKWVSMMMWQEHGTERSEHGTNDSEQGMGESHHESLEHISPLILDATVRETIFSKLTNPYDPLRGDDNDMPMLWSDYYQDSIRSNGEFRNQTLCRWQYDYLKQWKNGIFINDWVEVPEPASEITPKGLDRAALENCIGGPFYPGIEAGWNLRDKYDFIEPFRLSHEKIKAGDITGQMAIPWQADFYDCQQEEGLSWWPAQRPDGVLTEEGHEMVEWTRDHVGSYMEMVKNWHRLGFVIKKGRRFIESERSP